MKSMISVIKGKINTVIKDPKSILFKSLYTLSPLIGDKFYLKMLFPLATGYKLDLDNPQTYNEKLQWLKLYYRKPEMTNMVDKYEAKKIAGNIIGEEHIIKNYGVWNSFDEINFDELPNQFVLKTTNGSGGVIICKDKDNLDFKKSRIILERYLKRSHFYMSREWPYKNVKSQILAEKFLSNDDYSDLVDYKFLCFNGKAKILCYASERFKDKNEKVKLDYYDMELNHLPVKNKDHKNANLTLEYNEVFFLMKELAEKLSKDLPHVRIDLFLNNNKIYFGEYTFFHAGGLMRYIPSEWDLKFGELIKLPRKE